MRRGQPAGIFITATDTGVGKTFVGTGIARALRDREIDVGVMKPAETGCRMKRGELVPRDARALLQASGANDPLDLVNPYRFRPPVAPMVAAAEEGRTIAAGPILSAYRKLRERHDFLIVEGAGGIMVPLSRRRAYLDLAEAMGLPVLIIARPDLGTINHTVLTVMALRSREISPAAIVVNFSRKTANTLAVRTNPALIEKIIGVPVFAVPYGVRDLSPLAQSLWPEAFCKTQERISGRSCPSAS